MIREIPQNHHRFVLFDPTKQGNLMTPEFHGECSSQKHPSSSTIAADQQGHQLSILMSICLDHGILGLLKMMSFLDWVNLQVLC